MTLEITTRRLHNQRLSHTDFRTAQDVVSWLGAVQAQDYAGAKWALAQRMTDIADSALDEAFADGSFLRTHVLRPTWHFVSPQDIRWMLALTAPRVHALNAFMYRQQELDKPLLKKSYKVFEKALRGNNYLTRNELGAALAQAEIHAEGLRLTYIVMSAELDGVVCSGPRRGKQFTYALLEERVPPIKALIREEALAELTKRYFLTRGPATVADFAWWSGLTMSDAKKGIAMVQAQFEKEAVNGQVYWFSASKSSKKETSPRAFLLPNYDEYFIGFKDRSAIGEFIKQGDFSGFESALMGNVLILNGQIIGGWKRTLGKNEVLVEITLIPKLGKTEKSLIAEAAGRFGRFLELPVSVTYKEYSHE